MNRSIRMGLAVGLVCAGLTGSVLAEELAVDDPAPKAEKPAKAPEVVTDVTLSGKIVKEEKAGKEGKPAIVSYWLESEGEKIAIPQAKAEKDAPAAYDLAALVDQNVNITAQAVVTEKDGKKKIRVKKIATIAAVGEAAL